VEPWASRQLLKQGLEIFPFIGMLVLGGIYTLAVVLITMKRARKKWDEDFLSRYKEEIRSEIQERDAYIAGLERQLKKEQTLIREMSKRTRVAVKMSGKVSEILATADSTKTSQYG
jgi:predicted DNA-binding ArsR family transcriptional regulator